MLITTTHKIRAVLAVAAATIVATVGLGYGQAHAAPDCTASGLSSALGQVASSTGAWLSAHQEAEAAVNTADENAIRTYFATHQAQWSELQAIASPLRSLRQSCPQQVSPGDVARLYDAMASWSVRSPTTDQDSAHQAPDHMLVSVCEHAWPNVPSVTARCGGQNSSSSSMNSVGSKGSASALKES